MNAMIYRMPKELKWIIILTLDSYDYEEWYKEKSGDSTLKIDGEESYDLPLLESDEEVKEGKGLKVLTQSKLLTRFPVLLAQRILGKNSYKLKTKSDKSCIFCIS